MFVAIRLKRLPALLLALALVLLSLLYLRSGGKTGGGTAEALSKYDRAVMIIDPGHGGEDGGAQTAEGLLESKINLDISLRLDALAGLYGIPTVMTRATEEIAYPEEANTTARRKAADQRARLALINSYPEALLISIHQNCFPDRRPSGCQVLYAETGGSEDFAKLAHELLCQSLCPDNRRVAAPVPDNIYLMRNANCTAILVECGFLSNAREARLLTEESYQIKISAVLLAATCQYAAQSDGMI